LDLCWTFRSNGPIGWSSSPVIDDQEEVVYVGSADCFLYALEVESGDKLWSYCTGAPILTAPLIVDDKGIVESTMGTISAVSIDEGSVMWTLKTKHMVVATPLVHNDLMVVAGFDGKIDAIGVTEGERKWEQDLKEPVAVKPEQQGSHLFLGTKGGTFL